LTARFARTGSNVGALAGAADQRRSCKYALAADVQTGSSIPAAFLVLLVFWLAAVFTSFGLLAPINTTVITALFVCALSV
jgi:hypothetical protein